ncbi:hypothetical protein JCM33374_g4758 [Metschnikowia sp. JCM 33374]|nr:hypothetical protein JCM33374_g4758 [Metschnikowia sp. JCM 33374]
MKSATLRHTLNQVRAHPPKKLNSSLISEIHEKCTSAESLDDLLASSFFATVAWRFFHADVTNSHLELLLQVSTYEHEALSRQTCVETIKEDPSKLRDLLSRILQSTMVYRKQDVRLQACVFLFLRVLLVSSPSTLEDHPLFAKWCSSMFDSYTRALKTVPEGNTEMSSLLHCFLSLCLAAVVSKSVTCRDTVKDSWLPFHFMKEEFDFTTQRLASLIMLLLRPQPLEIFTSFQISIEKLSLQGKVPSAELAPSRFDVSAEEFGQNLHSLSKDDLLQLAEWAGCRNADESPDFLISVITHVVLGTGVSYRRLQNHEMFTEQDVFDLFDTPKQIAFVPSATFPAFMPLSTDYVAQIEARNAFEYLKQVNLRAESVLSRLTITDPTADRGIKGTSKYFSEIQHIEVYGSKARLNPKNNKIVGSISPGDVILLLEIQKPNRHGGVSRLIKNGINACALTRVHSTSEGIQVDWNSIGFEERFNALIVVPSPLGNTQEAYHQVPLCDTLVELASKDRESIDGLLCGLHRRNCIGIACRGSWHEEKENQ